jgi:hypothetical protein
MTPYHGPQGPPSKQGKNKGVARARREQKRIEAEVRQESVKPERTRQHRLKQQAEEW